MSFLSLSSEELDITVCSSLADLEKTLMQVKSLRYQIYSKYLSEKLNYEKQIRKLESDLGCCNSSKHSTQALSLQDLTTPRSALQERSINSSHISTQTTEDKAIQTCPNFSIPALKQIKDLSTHKSFVQVSKQARPDYDENLFKVVEQLEYLIKT
jgi:hypothetical protein